MVAVVLEVLMYLLTDLSFRDILAVSLAVALVSYLIGDLLVLSVSNNFVATLTDIILACLTIYIFNFAAGFGRVNFIDALICAAVLAVGEWIFHRYMERAIYPDRRRN
jgi:hypothetical protein